MRLAGQTPKDTFHSLVYNAIDFLYQSIRELEERPKYSLVNFYTAIELFLKARLMLEHWSLIYMDPQKANLGDFLNGDFTSVGLRESINRLENIAGATVTQKEYKAFDELRKDRNRLMHFFNTKYSYLLSRKNYLNNSCVK